MIITRIPKINVLKALIETIKAIGKSILSLILYTAIYFALMYVLRLGLIESGFTSFFGGQIVHTMLKGLIEALYLIAVIKTVSNVMEDKPHKIKGIVKAAYSKIIQIIFLMIILGTTLVPASVIILSLLSATTGDTSWPLMITYIILGLVCVKLIFSVHGVIVTNLDGLEGIRESYRITKGNYIRLVLTVVALIGLNYLLKTSIGNYFEQRSALIIAYYARITFMKIFCSSFVAAMYQQVIKGEEVHAPQSVVMT